MNRGSFSPLLETVGSIFCPLFFFCTHICFPASGHRGHRCRPFSPPVLAFNFCRTFRFVLFCLCLSSSGAVVSGMVCEVYGCGRGGGGTAKETVARVGRESNRATIRCFKNRIGFLIENLQTKNLAASKNLLARGEHKGRVIEKRFQTLIISFKNYIPEKHKKCDRKTASNKSLASKCIYSRERTRSKPFGTAVYTTAVAIGRSIPQTFQRQA